MQTINRSALFVSYKAPFASWVKSLPDDDVKNLTLEEMNDEASCYLIPDCDDLNELEEYLQELAPEIWRHEMETWSNDEDIFMELADYQHFKEFFDYKMASMPIDLTDGDLHIECLNEDDDDDLDNDSEVLN